MTGQEPRDDEREALERVLFDGLHRGLTVHEIVTTVIAAGYRKNPKPENAIAAQALRDAADDLEREIGDIGPGNRTTGYGRVALDLLRLLRTRADRIAESEPRKHPETEITDALDRALAALMASPDVPTGVRPHLLGGEVLVIRERVDAEDVVRVVLAALRVPVGEGETP